MSQKVGDARPETLEDTTIRDIHNILEPYYEVALDRFVDNVRMQVVDHYLISGPKSPLKLFSPIFVARLDAVQLESIAGEELIVKQTRANLEKDISLLKEGMRILRF
jgi:hypothetical protein